MSTGDAVDSAWESSHAPTRTWRCGAWALELRDDELADLSWNGRPVLRSVRAVARDHDWGTDPLEVTSVELGAELRVSLRGPALRGVVRATPLPDGGIRIACDLEATAPFDTNRTGLVVLHPTRLAGAPLRIAHAHVSAEGADDAEPASFPAFPAAISPHQPAFDIAGLAWQDDGLEVELAFAGDVFEMEDQRNWTDASFKTYSRPLALPFPYRLEAGERVEQSVSVRVRETAPETTGGDPDRVEVHTYGVFPEIGVGASTAPAPAPPVESPGSFTIVELDLATANWQAALERARRSALPLDVRVICSGDADRESDGWRTLVARLGEAQQAGTRIVRCSAYDSDLHVSTAESTDALRRCLAEAGVDAPVLGGSRSHFTELNREQHRLPAALDGIATTVTPLFHSLTTEQLIESVAVQRLVAAQTARLARDRVGAGVADLDVVFGPVMLRPRFNNVATAPRPRPTRSDLAEGYGAALTGDDDPRQSSPELAAWVIASAAALASGGATAVAYFEEWGPRGLRTADGEPLPALDAVVALASLSGAPLRSGRSADGLLWVCGGRVAAGDSAAGNDGVGDRVLVANLDRVPRTVRVVPVANTADGGVDAGCAATSLEVEIPLAAYAWREVVLDS